MEKRYLIYILIIDITIMIFYKLGIDLNKDDIDWWQFDTLLEGILLQKEGAMLTRY